MTSPTSPLSAQGLDHLTAADTAPQNGHPGAALDAALRDALLGATICSRGYSGGSGEVSLLTNSVKEARTLQDLLVEFAARSAPGSPVVSDPSNEEAVVP